MVAISELTRLAKGGRNLYDAYEGGSSMLSGFTRPSEAEGMPGLSRIGGVRDVLGGLIGYTSGNTVAGSLTALFSNMALKPALIIKYGKTIPGLTPAILLTEAASAIVRGLATGENMTDILTELLPAAFGLKGMMGRVGGAKRVVRKVKMAHGTAVNHWMKHGNGKSLARMYSKKHGGVRSRKDFKKHLHDPEHEIGKDFRKHVEKYSDAIESEVQGVWSRSDDLFRARRRSQLRKASKPVRDVKEDWLDPVFGGSRRGVDAHHASPMPMASGSKLDLVGV